MTAQGSTRFCEGCGTVRAALTSARILQEFHKAPQGSTRVPEMFCKVPWFALREAVCRAPAV